MSSLPTRGNVSGAPDNATARATLTAIYDFIAQRFAPGTSGAGAATSAEVQATRDALGVGDIGFRSRVINGDMSIDQRNEGAALTFIAAAVLAYCADMHYGYCTGANVTGQRITAADGTKRYRFTGAASVTGIGFGHRIEAADSVDLAGKTCTLSVKLANSLLTTVNWAVYYANTADTFGTLASPTRTAVASGSFAVTATEATYSAQVAVSAAATTGLEIVLTVGAQTSGTWTIGDLQLELGTIATANVVVDRVERGEQLRRCERSYEKSYAQGDAPGSATLVFTQICFANLPAITNSYTYGYVSFRTKKRVAPTVVPYAAAASSPNQANNDAGSGYGANSAAPTGQSQQGFAISNGTGATLTPSFGTAYIHYTAACPL